MGSLTRPQLAEVEKHLTHGQGRNPISVLMELGQVLHISPTFEIFETDESTVHRHVFKCKVKFANCTAEAEGYNKKLVKTDAARNMAEELLKLARRPNTTLKPTQQSPYTASELATSAAVVGSNQSVDSIGNAVGRLQEYCTLKRMGLPDYAFQEELLAGNRRKFIATVMVPGQSNVQSESTKSKMQAKQLAAHKMYSKVTSNPGRSTDQNIAVDTLRSRIKGMKLLEEMDASQNAQSGDDSAVMDTLRSCVNGLKLEEERGLAAPLPEGKSQITRVLKSVNLDPKCREALSLGDNYSALEKLTTILSAGNFIVDFHFETSPDGESHMCLVEAKIGVDLVCHGIASSQPEAKEIAASNMLSLFGFFSK